MANYGSVQIEHGSSYEPEQSKPNGTIKKLISVAATVIPIGTALTYFFISGHNLDRREYSAMLDMAKMTIGVEDNRESRTREDIVWSYIARVGREGDLHSVSETELQRLRDILNSNQVRGTPRGQPLD